MQTLKLAISLLVAVVIVALALRAPHATARVDVVLSPVYFLVLYGALTLIEFVIRAIVSAMRGALGKSRPLRDHENAS